MHSIYEEYERRLALAVGRITKEHKRKRLLLIALVACLPLSMTALLLSTLKLLCVIALMASGLAWQHYRSHRRWSKAGRERDYFRRGLNRLQGRWEWLESTGTEYRQADHVYQDDLNILGSNSLFQMLCTTRTKLGGERFARFLLEPVSLAESAARQAAVKDLVSRNALRESTASLGKTSVVDCSSEDVTAWLSMPLLQVSPIFYRLISICVVLTCLLSLGVYSKALDWHSCLPWIAILSFPPLMGAARYRTAVVDRLTVLRPISNSFSLLFEGIHLLEKQEFSSEKLGHMADMLRTSNASKHLRELARIFWWLEQREKPYFAFTIFVALGTLIVFSAERWRAQNGKAVEEWLSAWGTFEALQALACGAYERPKWTFPKLRSGPSQFQAVGLGHPLLPERSSICNDVSLGATHRYVFVSGSNMAGKSTLLRAIGLNTVLAYAGGPVSAEELSLTQMHLYASIAVHDELSAGKSRFMAEVQRIAAAMTASREGEAVLFLIDEILSGTNSEDRRFVANAFLTQILLGDALGVLTSHDLSLVENIPIDAVWHMGSCDRNNPLRFDYKLKQGLLSGTSGLALARLAGILD